MPQLAVTTAFGFVPASTIVFLLYLNHTAQAIRVATIIAGIAGECRAALERRHPSDDEPDPLPVALPGAVRIVGSAGSSSPTTGRCFGCVAASRTRRGCAAGRTSTRSAPPRGPPGFGLRQLLDIALRALSPGVNDPTTAVQVIDQLHDLLRRLAARPLPAG